MENTNNFETDILIPHSYPLWIKTSAIAIVCAFFFTINNISYYCELNRQIKEAETAFQNEDYEEAAILYYILTLLLTNNKHMKIRAAQSFFKSSLEDDHDIALNLLEDISLTNEEWADLILYMPGEYTELFICTKGKK